MKFIFIFLYSCLATSTILQAQNKLLNVKNEIRNLELNAAMKHGTVAMTIIDAQTGKKILDYNGEKGMIPASTQKTITSVLAYETLGQNFTYNTIFKWRQNNSLQIISSGDPTLGSDRFNLPQNTAKSILQQLKKIYPTPQNISEVEVVTGFLPYEKVNEGWIWQDLGNYYGAGALPFNWRENMFNIYLTSSSTTTQITHTTPLFLFKNLNLQNNTSADLNITNDNTLITYDFDDENKMNINGSIPCNKDSFMIRASYNNDNYMISELLDESYTQPIHYISKKEYLKHINVQDSILFSIESPTLDSIQYYFLHESINLYGEALLKTIAEKKYGLGSYENGIKAVHEFCKKINIDTASLHLFDGSGLSPQNRVTSNGLCAVLQYAKKQPWYNSFYNTLPVINNTKMKSGSIHQSRAYTGYIKTSEGKEYIFALLANGYEGKGKPIQQQLWKIIDSMK